MLLRLRLARLHHRQWEEEEAGPWAQEPLELALWELLLELGLSVQGRSGLLWALVLVRERWEEGLLARRQAQVRAQWVGLQRVPPRALVLEQPLVQQQERWELVLLGPLLGPRWERLLGLL